MPDVVDAATRSRMMSGIRGKNTRQEVAIRKALFMLGLRYRLHDPTLPGKPDLVFPRFRAVIFLNGCFWHAHDCHLFKWPQTRPEFWRTKILRNRENDKANIAKLSAAGWRVLTIWECALKGTQGRSVEAVAGDAAAWLHSKRGIWSIGSSSLKNTASNRRKVHFAT